MDSSHRLKMFKQMLRIRRLQERIDVEYLQDNMRTPVHLCIGQEAIAVGVCSALQKDDVISSNHRGHGHYLAKGGNMSSLVAELHCRTTGCSHGYGGSMHIIDTSIGHLGSSSIVAGGVPIGTGYGLAFYMRNEPRVSVVFLGDGASEEGVFYESIHFAVLKKLPVVFVLENNRWAVCSPLKNITSAGASMGKHACNNTFLPIRFRMEFTNKVRTYFRNRIGRGRVETAFFVDGQFLPRHTPKYF